VVNLLAMGVLLNISQQASRVAATATAAAVPAMAEAQG